MTGPTAVRQAYAVLRAVLNTAVADEALQRNPCRIKGAGQAYSPERPLLGLPEVEALTAAMPADLRTLVTLAFWAHTRLGEVLALRRGDVALDTGQLRIERQVVEVAGKGPRVTQPKADSRRTVHLPAPAVAALSEHLEALPPGLPAAPLFTRADGSMLRAYHVQYHWKIARARVGLPDVHFHDLRHAGLTLSAQAGATLAEVMRRAGHSSSAAALRYQHAADQRDALIASRLSDVAVQRQADRAANDTGSR
ncbi:MAG: site-specific integrase [Actinomycetota bacterium]|nr:site-specific integrase [Actinomycetota bacterium]